MLEGLFWLKESQIRMAYLSLVWIRDYFYFDWVCLVVDMGGLDRVVGSSCDVIVTGCLCL